MIFLCMPQRSSHLWVTLYVELGDAPFHIAKLNVKRHSVDLYFAITDYRSQAQTLDKILIDLNRRYGKNQIMCAGLYVACSRVTSFEGLAIMPSTVFGPPDLEYLKAIRYPDELEVWDSSYDSVGRFSEALCKAKYDDVSRTSLGARRKPATKRPAAATCPSAKKQKTSSAISFPLTTVPAPSEYGDHFARSQSATGHHSSGNRASTDANSLEDP